MTRTIDVVITIDTEADDQWKRGNPLTTDNLSYVPRFQEMCNRYALKPTYVCTYEVVNAPEFDTLAQYQNAGVAEVGAHLHPWSNPPFNENPEDTSVHPFPSELSDGEFRAKLSVLTELIEARTGRRPVSYRAGRWGFKASHVGILADLGYRVDCSVTPFTSWAEHRGMHEGGPDFRRAPLVPYYLDHRDVCAPGDSGLLEVPMTILCPKAAQWRLVTALFKRESSLGFRIGRKLFGIETEWFRPYPHMSAERLKNVYRVAASRGLPVVDLMFHSSELMPGGSPYNPTPESIEQLYERFNALFAFLAESGARGVTLREFAEKTPPTAV